MLIGFVWALYCLPGTLVLWIRFISPTEWGSKRNVSSTSRHWSARKILAPGISTAIYAFLILMILNGENLDTLGY